mmetsp:Transcript_42762/g.100421  ORF Transcript_42762/g.100421 Transcript_42762/m.100421 type:complete len:144 (-) Transcript_42762:2-433(-)
MSGYNDYDDEGHAEGGEMENPDSAMSILALYATTPNSMKSLRACKRCGMIRTHLQFHEEGCPNCPFLEMAEDQKATNEYSELKLILLFFLFVYLIPIFIYAPVSTCAGKPPFFSKVRARSPILGQAGQHVGSMSMGCILECTP